MVGLIFQTGLVAQSLDQASASAPLPPPPGSVANKARPARILVRPKAGVELSATHARLKGRLHKKLAHVQCEVVEAPEGRSARDLLESYRLDPNVEYAEEDVAYESYWPSTPNDTYFQNRDPGLWGLYNENAGEWHINAPGAWTNINSAPNVVVAVLDTGVRYTHQDLQANMWRNPGETAGDGIDNDGNGYVDDVFGIDAVGQDTAPMDTYGHGTIVAGIIGASGGNAIGVVGVAWQVKLMAIKANDSVSGSDIYLLSDLVEGVEYAIAKGANIINISSGSGSYSRIYLDALKAARAAGIIVVCAAGNAGEDNDQKPKYPTSYELDNIVSVSGLDRNGLRQGSSPYNYGQVSVDLVAPGTGLTSTGNSADDAYFTDCFGTSFAAPYVSGALALLRARYPTEDYLQLINRLYAGVALDGRTDCQIGGKLNLASAVAAANYRPVNDAYARRFTFSASGLTKVPSVANNRHATKEANEANHAGNSGGKSLWWRWQPALSGKYVVCTEGSECDTLLAIYQSTGNLPTTGTTPVAQDDNSAGDGTSRLVVDVTANTWYDIAVDGKNGAFGQIKLWVLPAPHSYLVRAANTLGYSPSYSTAVADTMQVVGNSANSGGNLRAASWANGVTTDLGTLGGAASEAYGVNETGVVIGRAQQANGYYRAFRWQSGTMSNLGTLGGTESEAKAVNGQGQIVGWSFNASAQHRAFVYDNATMTALPTLGGTEGYAYAMSDAGYIVGAAYTSSGEQHACRWYNGVATDLLTLGGNSSCAFAINAYGWIAGSARNAAGQDRACLWNAGIRTDMGTLGGATAVAYGINNAGQVVGKAAVASGTFHAFLWENGHMYDLNTLIPAASGWDLREAWAINENGEIAGWGVQAGATRSFLLSLADFGYRPTTATLTVNPNSLVFAFQLRGQPGAAMLVQSRSTPSGFTGGTTHTLDASGLASYSETLDRGTTRRCYRLTPVQPQAGSVELHPAFVRIGIYAGYSMIASPLTTQDSRLSRLLPNMPDGTMAYKWNEATESYSTSIYEVNYGGWGDSAMTLLPNEGVILRTPDGSPTTTVSLIGAYALSPQPNHLPQGMAIRSFMLPASGALLLNLGFPARVGDKVYKIVRGTTLTYTEYTALAGGMDVVWSPTDPWMDAGESFWSSKNRADEWTYLLE